MGEISRQIEELKALAQMDLLPEETKKEIETAIKFAESVQDFDQKSSTVNRIEIKYINKSNNKNPVFKSLSCKYARAIFDPLDASENILSPKKAAPIATPYTPPINWLSFHTSTE